MSVFVYISIFFVYVGIGVIFGLIRWTNFVEGELNFYEHERQRFMFHHRIRGLDIPEYLRPEWRLYISNSERLSAIPPNIHDHYGEVGFDVIVWPLSLIALAVQAVYALFMKRVLTEYNKVTTRKIERISKDLKGK